MECEATEAEPSQPVNLFVSVASIGNDPAWVARDAGAHGDYWFPAFGAMIRSRVMGNNGGESGPIAAAPEPANPQRYPAPARASCSQGAGRRLWCDQVK